MGYVEEPVEIFYEALSDEAWFDATTLPIGRGSYFQIMSSISFVGAIRYSNDGGETWSDSIDINSSAPSTFGYDDFVEFTNLHVTVNSGKFNIFYR